MRGRYVYFLNGERTDIREHWQVDAAPSGRRIRSERIAYGTTLSVDAHETDGALTRFDVRLQTGVHDIHAAYRLDGLDVHLTRSLNGLSSVHHQQAGAPFIAVPVLRVFTGAVILRLAALGRPGQVLIPWLLDPSQTGRLLLPHFDTRRARRLEHGPDGDLYEYVGEQYDETARFWVNAQGLLSRYTWQQGSQHWDVLLLTD